MSEHRSMQALAILAALFFFAAGVDAAVVFPGILDATYPTWNRISDRSAGPGGFTDSANDILPYEVLEIKTTAPGDILTATVNGGTQFDSFLALYSSFNPAFPLSNILAADDDGGGYPQAQLARAGLAANTSYFLVVSSYSSAANSVYPLYGSYGLTLGGSFSVVQKGTATVVSASSNPAIHGQPLTLTATVAKSSGIALPTGTITFKDGGTTIGTGTLNAGSQASLTISTLAAGMHSITALYGGETRYAASTSAPLAITVVMPPTVTGISPSSGTALGGTSVVITGSGFSGASAVRFNSTSASGFNVDSDTQITAVSPAGVAGMIADITVTTPVSTSALSSADQFTYTQDQARNFTTGTTYATLVTALSAALAGAEIRAFDAQCDGPFILVNGITLRGGWDSTFLVKAGTPTTLNGNLTIQSGASTAETLVVKGQLILQGGSLRVNDVMVRP